MLYNEGKKPSQNRHQTSEILSRIARLRLIIEPIEDEREIELDPELGTELGPKLRPELQPELGLKLEPELEPELDPELQRPRRIIKDEMADRQDPTFSRYTANKSIGTFFELYVDWTPPKNWRYWELLSEYPPKLITTPT